MPMPRPWQTRPRGSDASIYRQEMGIVASGAVATGDEPHKEAGVKSGATRAAQQQVWAYRRQVGELAHAIQFYENCFSRIRLTVAIEDDDGTRIPAFDENGAPIKVDGYNPADALQAIRQLRSPIGGQQQLMRAIGGCLGGVGEGHLVGTKSDRMKSGQSWEFLSPMEFYEPASSTTIGVVDNTAREYHRIRVPGAAPEIFKGDQAAVARIWQPDREFSLLPWAAPLGMLDLFDELVLLTREVAGAVRSRLALAGILLVADDIDYEIAKDDNAEPESDEADPFTADLLRVASIAIKDKASAAGVVPLVVRVPPDRVGEGGDKQGFRLLTFNRDWDDAASSKREECVTRFAQGIDLPVEVVKGHMSTTFANAAQISADMYRLYIEPKVSIGVDGLTSGYLQSLIPGCPFVIHPDPTDLIVKPDQTADWKDAFDRYAISWSSYRTKLGASEKDAPDDDEIEKRLEIDAAKRAHAMTEQPGGVLAPPEPKAVAGTEPGNETIAAAIEVQTRACMQRAGARLRSKVQRNPGLASMIANVPDAEVAATLGPRTVATLMTDAELVGREFEALHRWLSEKFDTKVADDYRAQAVEQATLRMFTPAGR